MWRLLAISVLAAATLLGQSSYEISGVVLDRVTGQGIAGVTVFLQSTVPETPTAPGLYEEATTDGVGKFRFSIAREGRFQLNVPRAQGYQGGMASANISAAAAAAQVRMILERITEAKGIIIDAETREAVAGLGVFLIPLQYRGGRLIATYAGFRVNTDGEGRFRELALSNGRYAAHIVPRLWTTSARHMTTFSEDELQKVDEDYEETYWPGGGSLDATLPQPVAPGVPTDFGTLRARKSTYYRARVRLAPGSCRPSDIFSVDLLRADGSRDSNFGIGCGRDVLLRGLARGTSYSLSATSTPQSGDQVRYATVPFTVTNGNLDLTVSPAPGTDLEGRIVLAEGARTWPAKMRVALQASRNGVEIDFNRMGLSRAAAVDTEGRFHFVNVPPGESAVTVTDHGAAHVIQEVRLGGTRIAADLPAKFNWQGTGSLEIVVDDQPGVISGTVTDGSFNASQPTVFVFPWPLSSSRAVMVGDAQGKFESPHLRAGEYRVLAVPAGSVERIEEPGVLDRLLSRAEKVTLMRGGSANVALTLLHP